MSYPITRADFDRARADNPFARISRVGLSAGGRLNSTVQSFLSSLGMPMAYRANCELELLLGVHWEGPHSPGYTVKDSARFTFRAVESARRAHCRATVTGRLLPEALIWLQTVAAAPETVRDGSQAGYGFLLDGEPHFGTTVR